MPSRHPAISAQADWVRLGPKAQITTSLVPWLVRGDTWVIRGSPGFVFPQDLYFPFLPNMLRPGLGCPGGPGCLVYNYLDASFVDSSI